MLRAHPWRNPSGTVSRCQECPAFASNLNKYRTLSVMPDRRMAKRCLAASSNTAPRQVCLVTSPEKRRVLLSARVVLNRAVPKPAVELPGRPQRPTLRRDLSRRPLFGCRHSGMSGGRPMGIICKSSHLLTSNNMEPRINSIGDHCRLPSSS